MRCVISLVFSVHEEHGLANAEALHALLLDIRPEVIFLEVPPAAFDDFYLSRSRRNLESDAVNFFLKDHPHTKLIPSDLPTPSREFFEDYEQLRMQVRETSPTYKQLMRLDRDRLGLYGFAYLNSKYCSQLWSDVRTAILKEIEGDEGSRLPEIQEAWERTNELRELEMLSHVRRYCGQSSFVRGALLVGAAHRRSLIEKLQTQSEINWDLLEFGLDP